MNIGFNPKTWPRWVETQIAQEKLPTVPVANMVYELCCELYRNSTLVSFAHRALLLWPRCTPGENLDPWPDDPRDAAATCVTAGGMLEEDRERLLNRLRERGIRSIDHHPLHPELFAFEFAGGGVPIGWTFHHLYNGEAALNGRKRCLDARKHGRHFSQTAGMVAIHPIVQQLFTALPVIRKTLRARAYTSFGYDPEDYFSKCKKDELGFVTEFVSDSEGVDAELPDEPCSSRGYRIRARVAELQGRRVAPARRAAPVPPAHVPT